MKLIMLFGLIISLMVGPHPVPVYSVSDEADRIVGVWLNAEKEGRVQIAKVNGHYIGKLVWLKEPNTTNGMPKLDDKNPEAAKRSRPILGLTLIYNLTYSGDNEWGGGSIYDARSGRTYRCKLSLQDAQTLDVRGYMGISLLGRTTTWTRLWHLAQD